MCWVDCAIFVTSLTHINKHTHSHTHTHTPPLSHMNVWHRNYFQHSYESVYVYGPGLGLYGPGLGLYGPGLGLYGPGLSLYGPGLGLDWPLKNPKLTF